MRSLRPLEAIWGHLRPKQDSVRNCTFMSSLQLDLKNSNHPNSLTLKNSEWTGGFWSFIVQKLHQIRSRRKGSSNSLSMRLLQILDFCECQSHLHKGWQLGDTFCVAEKKAWKKRQTQIKMSHLVRLQMCWGHSG